MVVDKGWVLLELHKDTQTLEDVFRHLTVGDERSATASCRRSRRRPPAATTRTTKRTTTTKATSDSSSRAAAEA